MVFFVALVLLQEVIIVRVLFKSLFNIVVILLLLGHLSLPFFVLVLAFVGSPELVVLLVFK